MREEVAKSGLGHFVAGCEHVFVSIKGSAYARFRRALETDSPSLATAAAYELPQLNLADALRLCLVYALNQGRRARGPGLHAQLLVGLQRVVEVGPGPVGIAAGQEHGGEVVLGVREPGAGTHAPLEVDRRQ